MRRAVALLGLAFAATAFAADEDKDLDLIPEVQRPTRAETSAASPSDLRARIYAEDALAFAARRDDLLVPAPPPLPSRRANRLFMDAHVEWAPSSTALFVYSGRLGLRAEEGLGFAQRGTVTHDLREAYASFEPWPHEYLDAGRVNVKSGVALGFNPTDFFKARAVVDPLTADPRVLREDRLGTLMVRGQRLGEAGSLSVAYAPRVADPAPVAINPDRFFDPLFDRTNGSDRVLVKGSARWGDGLNPEGLLFLEKGRVKAGLNLTQTIGQSTVVYLEWAGGRRLGLIDEALAFGRKVGTIPPGAPDVITQGGDERFRSQLAVGASYTSESKITWNLEYHYNGAGFSGADWDRWFTGGGGRPASSPITRQLWFIRAYASDRQEPLQKNAVFLRLDWVDFLVPKLELTGFALADAGDGSMLVQLAADYARTDQWSLGVLATATTGGRRSNFGSLPPAGSILFKATRYL